MTEKQEVQIWKPSEFKGADLLPVAVASRQVDVIGRENVKPSDLVFPVLKVLQGSSNEVKNNVEGARAGLFFLSSVQEVFNPPIRVLVCAHTRSRALFPKSNRKKYEGLEKCMSPNGETGSIYGACEKCPHKEWDNANKKDPSPPCSESHNFTVLTPMGPAIMRFNRTSFKTAKNFVSTWVMSEVPIWTHPAVIRTTTRTDNIDGMDSITHVMEIRWLIRETVPPAVQAAAREVYEQVKAAHAQGRFDNADAGEDDNPY